MTCEESIKWLDSLIKTLGQSQYQSLWNWEQPLTEIKEMLESKRVVELPCKVGDTVYCIAGNIIFKSKIHCISFGGRFGFDGGQIHIYDYDKDNASMPLSYFGKRIFFTKEEAEQKLKELKENV